MTKKPVAPAKKKPGRRAGWKVSGTFSEQLANLEVGATICKSVRLPLAEISSERVAREHKAMADSVSTVVYRQNTDHGRVYMSERASVVLSSYDAMLVILAVTRTK